MRSHFLRVPAVLLLFALSASIFAVQGSKGKPATDTAVTTTIDGLGVDTLPTRRIQSDQGGAYKNSSSLQSVLQASLGDWVLDTLNFNSLPQRTILIDLRDQISGPTRPFDYQLVRARLIARFSLYGHDFRTILPVDGPTTCPLAIAFVDSHGVSYRLAQNPENFIDVDPVLVTCDATDANNKCNQWTIEPSAMQANGEWKNRAKLLKLATKPNQADQDMGNFYMSFTIHLTNP
jgi:hypothetical protein